MDLASILLAGLIVGLASAAQSAVGFGYAMFATPLLIWVGIPLPSAITLVATCSLLQAAIGARTLHAAVPWRLALTASAVGFAGLMLGLMLLKRLVALDVTLIRAVIGGILCVLVAVQLRWRPHPTPRLPWGWGGVAFFGSGVLAGICGMGGPPVVMWAMAHDWSNQKTRGFLFAVFATSIPLQLLLLSVTFGVSILTNAALGLAYLPLVALGSAMGLPVGNRMGKARLRRVAFAILLAIGISSMAPVIATWLPA
jgi:uncharacterized membrane protein YfcA